MKKKILFIDDEPRRMQSYVDELKDAGYEVIPSADVDSAFEYFEKNSNSIDLLIMDVMMPPGKVFKKQESQIASGLRTGILLSDEIRKINNKIPIIVLTNVLDDELSKKDDEENNRVFQKENYLPYQLVEKIEEMLK